MAGYKITGSNINFFIEKDGVNVLGPYGSFWAAEAAIDALRRKERMKKRSCITCSEEFQSEGPHVRMCNGCRSRSSADGWAA